MTKTRKSAFRRPLRRGFTLVELAISFFVMGMIVVLFSAVFPVVTRGSYVSGNNAQASLLAQHKIDQVRQAGFGRLNTTQLNALGIVDSSPAPVSNPSGFPTGSVSYSFTNTDALVTGGGSTGYFPAGSTGTLTIGPVSSSGWTPPGTSSAQQITVTIQWQGGSQSSGSFTTHTVMTNV